MVTDPAYDFSQAEEDLQVLVLDAETRHLTPEAAYGVVFRAVEDALKNGFTYIYKKTDSALRGNVGAELTAVLDAAGADSLAFLPALPGMDRVTRKGIHYIGGVPVAESVFGQDPFEPVTASSLTEIIGAQSKTPVVLHETGAPGEEPPRPGIQVYDAETDGDLLRIGRVLGKEGLRLSAGCAGFASVLAELLELEGSPPERPYLVPSLFVACGSVNQVTLRQMETAEAAGFAHVHLTPKQKLETSWACPSSGPAWTTARASGTPETGTPTSSAWSTPWTTASGWPTQRPNRKPSLSGPMPVKNTTLSTSIRKEEMK